MEFLAGLVILYVLYEWHRRLDGARHAADSARRAAEDAADAVRDIHCGRPAVDTCMRCLAESAHTLELPAGAICADCVEELVDAED